jgi:hypothetical protein
MPTPQPLGQGKRLTKDEAALILAACDIDKNGVIDSVRHFSPRL